VIAKKGKKVKEAGKDNHYLLVSTRPRAKVLPQTVWIPTDKLIEEPGYVSEPPSQDPPGPVRWSGQGGK
jgi:hypothetical protein